MLTVVVLDCVELVVVGSDGQVCWTRQPAPDQDLLHWSWVQRPDSRIGSCQPGNVTLAPQLGGRLAIGVNSDSHPEVFAWCASDTGIYHAWRNLTDNTWNNWTQLNADTGFAGAPDAALAAEYGQGSQVEKWRQVSDPFHWYTEFYPVMSAGGFDVVAGNPPYVARGKVNYEIHDLVTAGARHLSRLPRLREHLGKAGIGTGIHYPLPVHLHPAYRRRVPVGPTGLCHSEAVAREILSLPMYPQLPDAAVDRVIAETRRFFL